MLSLIQLTRTELIDIVRELKKQLHALEAKRKRNIDVLERRVVRKNDKIRKQSGIIFILEKRLYGQKLKTSKVKTQAKNQAYEEATNNIVNKEKSLIDISKYHMSILELSEVFGESPATIVVLLWAGRYEYYSKKEFNINFPDSPINFVKYNTTLNKRGLCNKWDNKRYYYYISASGKDMITRINKYIEKRMNG
jgi:hypothetical protein